MHKYGYHNIKKEFKTFHKTMQKHDIRLDYQHCNPTKI